MQTENQNNYKFFKLIAGFLIILDVIVWGLILFPRQSGNFRLYFLDVGQGDSSLVVSPAGTRILIDGGPLNGNLQQNLEKILPLGDRYLDIVIVSHPELDHFAGLLEVLKNYKIGAVVTNGQVGKSQEWREFENLVKEKNLPEIVLAAGDKISSRDFLAKILSPSASGGLSSNDLSLVILLESQRVKSLFTADIGADNEKLLANLYDLDVDVLKVSHHGSKYSSDVDFLKKITPIVSVIEVGKNTYGHPTPQAINNLTAVDSRIFRTDKDGLLKIEFINNQLKVFASKFITH